MKILRYLGYFILGEVAERLKTAFHEAAENLIQHVFGEEIAEFEEAVKAVKEYIADFEATIKDSIVGKSGNSSTSIPRSSAKFRASSPISRKPWAG